MGIEHLAGFLTAANLGRPTWACWGPLGRLEHDLPPIAAGMATWDPETGQDLILLSRSLPERGLRFFVDVLLHEVAHLALDHVARGPQRAVCLSAVEWQTGTAEQRARYARREVETDEFAAALRSVYEAVLPLTLNYHHGLDEFIGDLLAGKERYPWPSHSGRNQQTQARAPIRARMHPR
jgi:hypothetical protein